MGDDRRELGACLARLGPKRLTADLLDLAADHQVIVEALRHERGWKYSFRRRVEG